MTYDESSRMEIDIGIDFAKRRLWYLVGLGRHNKADSNWQHRIGLSTNSEYLTHFLIRLWKNINYSSLKLTVLPVLASMSSYLFPSWIHESPHLSTRQYARIVNAWVIEIGLDPSGYGTHTMRRTKASLIYRRTKNLRAVQLLLGQTKLESTVRYLGIEVDDALEMAEQTEV